MRPFVLLVILAGCAPEGFPDDPVFSSPETLEVPAIEPIEAIFERAALPDRAVAAEEELQGRGGDLRNRAEALRTQDQ